MRSILRRLPLVYTLIVYLFLMSPLIVVVLVSFNAGPIVRFPPAQWSLEWYRRAVVNKDFIDSFTLSAVVASVSTAACLVIGSMASLALVRHRFRGSNVVKALLLSPLIFPQVVLGLALLQFFSIFRFGLRLETLILAHVVVCLPFVVQIVSATLYGFDRSLEEASRTLGAGPLRTFIRITLPVIRSGVVSGGLFAFILSFDNVGVSLFLSSGARVTVPIRMYQYVESQYDPSIAAVSAFLIGFAAIAVFALARLGTLDRVFMGRGGGYGK